MLRKLIKWINTVAIFGLASAAAIHIALVGYIIVSRLTYPGDLEWMEGGVLVHALRLTQGKPIYAAPSADFIAFLYTPFYPWLLSLLSYLTPLSYALGRCVSFAAFCIATLLAAKITYRLTRQSGHPYLWSIICIGLIASTFPHIGYWYDLVRADSLYLCLIVAGLYLLSFHRKKTWAVIAAAILMSTAFLTKQTASLFIIASGTMLLATRFRGAMVFTAVVATIAGGISLLLNHHTAGWYWRYIYKLHQGHDLYWDRIFPETELTLFKFFPAAAIVLGLWLLWRVVSRLARHPGSYAAGTWTWVWWTAVGIGVSAVGFATQWAESNAYMPALFLGAIATPIVLAQFSTALRSRTASRIVQTIGCGALIAQLASQIASHKPSRQIPSTQTRAAFATVLEQLERFNGPVLMPYHPWYPVIVGKPASYHQMGINDITRAGYAFPPDIIKKIQTQHYSAIWLDNPIHGRYDFALQYYKFDQHFPPQLMPAVTTGYDVRPTYLFVPLQLRGP